MQNDVWTYREQGQRATTRRVAATCSGYHVEALDGSIGKIDEATYEVGKKLRHRRRPVDLRPKGDAPRGVIDRVDEADEKVWVNRTKEQIKDSGVRRHDDLGSQLSRRGRELRRPRRPAHRDFDHHV